MWLFPEHAEEKIVISIITPTVISSAAENHFYITAAAEADIYVKFLSGACEIIEHHEVIADLSAEEGPDSPLWSSSLVHSSSGKTGKNEQILQIDSMFYAI